VAAWKSGTWMATSFQPTPVGSVREDNDLILHATLARHRAVMQDGEPFCVADDEHYPCEQTLLALIALRLGRVLALLDERLP
jgi:hypothetical protein